MRVQRYLWSPDTEWASALPASPDPAAQLVLSFGPVDAPSTAWFDQVRERWPQAQHVYCCGGGQIMDDTVLDEETLVTVVHFASAQVHAMLRTDVEIAESGSIGLELGEALRAIPDLQHVLLFTEGLGLNAARFVGALNASLPGAVRVSGGLASNGLALDRTVVGLNGPPAVGQLVAIGLSGASLVIRTGSSGGGEAFGPSRVVTRSEGPVLYELDGERALDVYSRYLGKYVDELPGSALLFPLLLRETPDGPSAVRTVLAVDAESGAMRFAGDIPQGGTVRLTRTTADMLIDGAGRAARRANGPDSDAPDSDAPDSDATRSDAPTLTICVSCIGRRAVMRSRAVEELEEVSRAMGGAAMIGFYSNGEIAPPQDGRTFAHAVLHNQTMTITTLSER